MKIKFAECTLCAFAPLRLCGYCILRHTKKNFKPVKQPTKKPGASPGFFFHGHTSLTPFLVEVYIEIICGFFNRKTFMLAQEIAVFTVYIFGSRLAVNG